MSDARDVTNEEISRARKLWRDTDGGFDAAMKAALTDFACVRSLPGRSAETPPKHSVCECIGGSSYATEDPAWRHCDVCGGLIATNPATGDYRSAEVPAVATAAMTKAALHEWRNGHHHTDFGGMEKTINAALSAAAPAYPAADSWTREQVAALVRAARTAVDCMDENGLSLFAASDALLDLHRVIAPFAALAEQDGKAASPTPVSKHVNDQLARYSTEELCDESTAQYRSLLDGVVEAPAAGAPAPDAGEWWCPECKAEIASVNVTYQETHDERAGGCGCHVIWREKGSHSGEVSAPAPDRLAELAEKAGKSLIGMEVIDGVPSVEHMATFFIAFAADRRGAKG